MNRTLKEATVKRYHYGTHAQLKEHLHAFLMAYNFAKRLKTLRCLTPYEHICKVWTTTPYQFRLNPLHHSLGLNTSHTRHADVTIPWSMLPLLARARSCKCHRPAANFG
jgi:hypothetical protein